MANDKQQTRWADALLAVACKSFPIFQTLMAMGNPPEPPRAQMTDAERVACIDRAIDHLGAVR